MPDSSRVLTIHQAVHGYRGGHRLMAASISLNVDAEAILLTMSDGLTSELLGSSESYLTGYPLKDAHKFVLARTWAAPESSRRGSVWTHSLILDYSTLTQLEDVFVLLQLFRRPQLDSIADFGRPVSFRLKRTSESLVFGSLLASDVRIRGVLAMVYGETARNRIKTWVIGDAEDEALALGVWRQMWPSLRRSFSFSTRASAEELGLGEFGLSFEQDASAYKRQEMTSKNETGLAYLAKDVSKRGPTRLRRFLGRYAYDAKSPRLIVPSLAAIFAQRKDAQEAIASYETLLRDAPGLGRLKQDLLLFSAKDRANPAALSKSLEMFAHEPAGSSMNALVEAIRGAPFIANGGAIIRVISEAPPDSVGDQIFSVVAEVLPIEILATEVPVNAKFRLLHFRREVVEQRVFWKISDVMRRRLLGEAISLGIPAENLLTGLRGSLTVESARQLLEYDSSSMLAIYKQAASCSDEEILDLLATQPGFISALSKSQTPVPITFLERFARAIVSTDHSFWCSSEETADLIARCGSRPTYAQPYLAALAFKVAVLSRNEQSRLLFGCVFDAVLDSSDRFTMPLACQRLLLTVPALVASSWLPERLFDAALGKYSQGKNVDAGLFCVTSNPDAIARLARHVIKHFGEDELRRVYPAIVKLNCLQVPREVVDKALKFAMPLFSKPLRNR